MQLLVGNQVAILHTVLGEGGEGGKKRVEMVSKLRREGFQCSTSQSTSYPALLQRLTRGD